MVKRIIIVSLLWLMMVNLSWATVSSSVDQTELTYGDALQLTITANHGTGVAPDLSVLNDDFEIASQRHESQFSLINGTSSQTSRWILSLSTQVWKISDSRYYGGSRNNRSDCAHH